jgi:predicted amidohydrolase
MDNAIKIALVQADLYWEDIQKNLQKFDRLLQGITTDTEIIILPEMFATAFTVDTERQEKPVGKRAFKWLLEKAKELQKIIVGSILFEEEGEYYNRMFWMRPNGTYEYYDKRHLFQMGNEHHTITAGNRRVIVSHKNTRFLLQVCYDLRFPVAAKNRYNPQSDKYDYDVIIYVANWPEVRKQAYMTLLKARAIENQAYVVWVNRVGVDAKNQGHSGDSQVINTMGQVITHVQANQEEVCYATINLDEINKVRTGFKVGLDWDSFEIL